MLLLARDAARLEEVEHDPVPLAAGQIERRAVGQLAHRFGRGAVEQGRLGGLVGGRVGAGEDDEQAGQ